ncbi:MAG: fibronectin [Actinomycetota bacterium]
MSAMRALSRFNPKAVLAYLLSLVLSITVLIPIEASALSFNAAPAKFWGYIYASDVSTNSLYSRTQQNYLQGEVKSEWRVTYNNFPADAKDAVQYAIDIWARNFESKVPITVEASWEENSDNRILGSARPGYYFNDFPGAPDANLWYPSALANALAGRDLDPRQKEIFLSVNSTPLWSADLEGKPSPRSYDLVSVIIHEIAHGLGFLSNAEYDRFFGTGYMFQPTPFDAYVQLPDGRTFTDFCSRSADLGKAMLGPLYWNGEFGVAANNGVKPKLYAPSSYQEGSSITHLDEDTFANSLTNSAMTPNLEPGEVFRSPGPIALGMIRDMMKAPPAKAATGLPAKPVNVKALVGDGYALLTFDSPNCSRVDRIKSYKVTISPGGESKTYDSSPIRIGGLKNGKSYKFTLVAENDKGASEPVDSNSVKPQKSGGLTTVDPFSRVSNLSSIVFRGNPTIVYGDEATRSLKVATLSGTRWRVSTARKGVDVGPISLCKSGTGSKESLHVFYGETTRKDLIHSNLSAKKWSHETVDGNGEDIQDYREELRRKTASDVSVSNACAVTSKAVQVFYRDESQGILLGAVLTSKGWVYEIVDGDSTFEDRTTGDVAFHLSATSDKNRVFLLYDSVLTINSNRTATSGEVRLATRKSIYPEDWSYQTLDGPDSGNAVAGYATAIFNNRGSITATWLVSRGDSLPDPSFISYAEVSETNISYTVDTSELGTPSAPLLIDSKGLTFGCQSRVCKAPLPRGASQLASGSLDFSKTASIITIKKVRYLAISREKKVTLVRL